MFKHRVLELGFGDAKRISHLARTHKNIQFLGIELKKGKGFQMRQHNLKLSFGDALKKIKRLPSKSCDVAYLDAFDLEPIGAEKAQYGFFAHSDLFVKRFSNFLKDIRRVLLDNGRLHYSLSYGALKEFNLCLKNSGFKITQIGTIPKSRSKTTTDLECAFKKIEQEISKNPEDYFMGDIKAHSLEGFYQALRDSALKNKFLEVPWNRPITITARKDGL